MTFSNCQKPTAKVHTAKFMLSKKNFEKAEKNGKSRKDRKKAEKHSKSRIFLLKAEEVATLVSYQIYGSHACGASLLTPEYAVTAAHCVVPYRYGTTQ